MTAKKSTSAGLEIPQITILSDHPILDKKLEQQPDLLQVENKLRPILDILRHEKTQCPMTIGIIGKWGTGKSSAMKWLESELGKWNELSNTKRKPHPKVIPVWFAPWKYSSREDVWRGIIAEIILKCVDEVGSNTATTKRQLISGAKGFGRFLGKSFLSALANTTLKLGDITGNGVEVNGELYREISDEFHKEIHPEKAYLNEFENTLHTWLKDYLEKDKKTESGDRVVVFIDDLDRCLPEVTLEVLEAIKLYLNIPQLIFVIGLDREVVDSVVSRHYKKQGLSENKSSEYLNKIFQIDFHIEPSQNQIENFFDKQFKQFKNNLPIIDKYLTDEDGLNDYGKVIREAIQVLAKNNPREIKRTMNTAFLKGYEASTNSKLDRQGNKNLRFAQGVQVALLQKHFQDHLKIGSILVESNVQKWLENISYFLNKNKENPISEYRNLKVAIEQKYNKLEFEKNNDMVPDEKNSILKDLNIDDFRPPSDIQIKDLNKEWIINLLLKIQFSSNIAASTAQKITNKERAYQEEQKFEQLKQNNPVIFREIARELDKKFDNIISSDLLNVNKLNLSNNNLNDISVLSELSNLKTLYLSNNQVSDISVLKGLANLSYLYLSNNQVSDLSVLKGLTSLRDLDLNNNQVSYISVISELTNLRYLYLSDNKLSESDILELKKLLPETRIIS